MGDPEPGTIQGSSWYIVIIMALHPRCHLASDLGIDHVAICFEQFSRKDRGKFVAWPFDVLDAKVVTGTTDLGVEDTFKPWISYEEQREAFVKLSKNYEASDFGSQADGNDQVLPGPFDDGASSADTSVGGGAAAPTGDPLPYVDPWHNPWANRG